MAELGSEEIPHEERDAQSFLRQLLLVLEAVRCGDFTVSMPQQGSGLRAKLSGTVNDLIRLIRATEAPDERIRRRVERTLTLRNRISNIFLTVPDRQMYGKVIELVLDNMDSPYGLFGYVDEAGYLICPSVPEEVWDRGPVGDHTTEFSLESMHEIWQRAITEKRTILSNQPTPVPEGYLPVGRSLSVPILHGGHAVGLLHLANKPSDYDDQDRELLEGLALYIAPVLDARLCGERQETRRVEAEEALASKAKELERSNMELSQFAHVASHDLQEPLRMVASFTSLLRERYAGQIDEEADTYIDYAIEGATRMRELIDGLLTFSQVESAARPLEPVDSAEVVEQVRATLQVAIGESRAEVEVGELPRVMAAREQLHQLFQNLIANAIKFCGQSPPRIRISAFRLRKEWVVVVKDRGIGIEQEYHEQIFQIFQRLHTRQEYPGVGIGLAICKRIVERHGGRIWLESTAGVGTSIFFTLQDIPVETADGEAPPENNG